MYISYKKYGIRIGQAWFTETLPEEKPRADIVFFHGSRERKEGSFCRTEVFHTLFSDLSLPEEELYGAIHKNVRYEIRKNEKEPMTVQVFAKEALYGDEKKLEELENMYHALYLSKGMNQALNHGQLLGYAKTGALVLTEILSEGQPLVIHSYLTDGKQTRLLHSVSEFRNEGADANLVARANKRLHWEDMKYFKEHGVSLYDWGGISNPDNPNGIDAFKMKFGGAPETYYNVLEGKSLPGKLAVMAIKWKDGRKKRAEREAE